MGEGKRTFRSTSTGAGMRIDVAFSEKRSAVRKPVQVGAQLHSDGGVRLQARTVDLSTSGVCLLVEQSLAAGELWHINFTLPVEGELHQIEALGRVAQRVVGAGGIRIGFQFIRVSMTSMIAIARFMR